jgi:predicted TPR repeat methyltransferase
VSNEIEELNPVLPVPIVPPMPEAALRTLTHDLPIAQLLRQGREQLKLGDPEGALAAFTAVLSLDPKNREAAAGARDAGRMRRDRTPRRRAVPSPPPETP